MALMKVEMKEFLLVVLKVACSVEHWAVSWVELMGIELVQMKVLKSVVMTAYLMVVWKVY